MKSLTHFHQVWTLSLLLSAHAHAASTTQLDVLRPFLDPHSVAILELNLDALDVATASTGLIEALPEPRELWAQPIRQAGAALEPWHREFLQAGGQRVYLVASLAWLAWFPPDPPFAVVAPLIHGADPDRLKAALAVLNPRWPSRILHGCLVAEPENVFVKLETGAAPPATWIRWQTALTATPPGVARLMLVPYAESERVIEDVLPTLPRMLGGGPGTILSRGLRWGGVSLRLPPQAGLSLVIESDSADAALGLRRAIEHGLNAVGEMPEVQRELPAWSEIKTFLLPVASGNRLVRELDLSQVVQLAQAIQPSLEEARAKAQRVAIVNRLKQIGLALHIHASDHGDRFPLHLADALPQLGDPRVLLHPGDSRVPPADLATQSRDVQIQWIDQHSPFVYVRPGALLKEIQAPGSTVVVHERFEIGQDQPVGVLFIDGSVQMLAPGQLQERLEAFPTER